MSEAPFTGGCACGAIRYRADGPVKFAFRCQCRACQRDSGGGHMAIIAVAETGFALTGSTATHERLSDAGRKVIKHFCATCGCPVFSRPDAAPDWVMLAVGSLDNPAAVDPSKIVYSEFAAPWDRISEHGD